jgi:uncharacterized protein
MPTIEKHPAGAFTWIELASSDQDAAKTFYSGLFGYSIVDYPMGPSGVYTMFRIDDKEAGAAYTMSPKEQAAIPPHWNLYIAVDNADEAAALAKSLGATVIEGPFDVMDAGRMAVIQDPTGAYFCIWQAKNSIGIRIAGVPGTLCWADLNTPDAGKAKAFYESMFRWKIEASENDSSGYLHIKNGEAFIGGIPPAQYRNPNAPPHWMIYFDVKDVDQTTAKAKELGGKVYMEPMTMEKVGRIAVLADPQGAAFSIFTPA